MPWSPPCPSPPHGGHLLLAAGLVTVYNWDLHHCISTMLGIIFLQFLSHHSLPTPASGFPTPLPAGSSARAVSGAQTAALYPTVPAGFRQTADRFLPTLSLCFIHIFPGSGAVYQIPLPLSSCKNSINTFFLIRNAGTGGVVDCSHQSNLAFITKAAVCLPSARVKGEMLFNHPEIESWILRRKSLAQVGLPHAGLSPFPTRDIPQRPVAVPCPTYPFDSDHQHGRPDGARVDAVAPAVVVDPHGDGEDSKHDECRSLGLVELCQG